MRTPARFPRVSALLVVLLVLSAATEARAAWPAPARAQRGIVASPQPLATRAGEAILAAGGSAVDVAVATSLAVAVTEPYGSGVGGGAFAVVHVDGETTTFDMRETAPAAASRDMYVKDGHVVPGESTWSARASGIPGLVRGLVVMHARYGRLPLSVVAAPAISYARDGIPVTEMLHGALASYGERLNAAGRAIFLAPSGEPWPVGTILRQPDLARTLERVVATRGEDFYVGETAKALVAAVQAEGGIWTAEDLAGYKVVERPPVTGTYRGFAVRSMGPPSSGGLLLVQMLGVLEAFDVKGLGFGSASYVHRLAETTKRAFAMRAHGLGDPDQYAVDWQRFIGPAVIARLRAQVAAAERATPAADIAEVEVKPTESTHTSHLGVLFANGDAVAMTQTVNLGFGSGHVAAGTGVVLNNEMDDFSALPGAPNAFGLIGDEANAIAPHKRPLSSMTPTILLRDGQAVGVFGSPGGSTIITTTLQLVLNCVDHGMDAGEAAGAPRVHHQWYPDALFYEPWGLSPDTRAALEARGHTLQLRHHLGNGSALWRAADGRLEGAADPRGEGTAGGL
ncbi:MAG: gamma-glutamyltransferase [Deltaproteobacteria bacterium]|nr:MAG: gamma-glutamyltransferase [Deltaproteobacteria bacterium]